MSVTAGVISLVSKTSTTVNLSATAATGGTGPYTYQWYRSTTSGFTPGGGNILAGKTALTLADTGLTPGTLYYYKLVVTDTGASSATAEYAQLAVTTDAQTQSPNSFAQSSQVGTLDLHFNPDTVSVQVDSSEAATLSGGQAVKVVDSGSGVPKVVKCAANSDEVAGFLVYDIKSQGYVAGDRAEMAMDQNVMYLWATGAIARFAQVSLDLTTVGGVRSAAGHTGDRIVGFAYDKASAGGVLIRVKLSVPSFTVV